MKIIINIILLINIFTLNTYANISKSKIEQYYHLSREKNTYKCLQSLLNNKLLTMTNSIEEKYRPQLIKDIQRYIENPNHEIAYKNAFLSLDSGLYEKLISFYKTKIGKKYAKAINKMRLSEESIRDKYIKLKANNQISTYRSELISSLIKELNTLEIKIDYEYAFFLTRAKVMHITSNLETLTQKHMIDFKVQQEEYEPIFMSVLLIDFSETDLIKLLKFAQLKSLQLEEKYHINAQYNFYKDIALSINKITDKLTMIPLCKNFTIDETYPKGCKTEWLNHKK